MPIHCDRIIQAGKFLIKSDKIKDESHDVIKIELQKLNHRKCFWKNLIVMNSAGRIKDGIKR